MSPLSSKGWNDGQKQLPICQFPPQNLGKSDVWSTVHILYIRRFLICLAFSRDTLSLWTKFLWPSCHRSIKGFRATDLPQFTPCKFKAYGVQKPALQFIKSYLLDSKQLQRVKCNDTCSNWLWFYAVVPFQFRENFSIPYCLTSLWITWTNPSPSPHYTSTQTTLPNCASMHFK